MSPYYTEGGITLYHGRAEEVVPARTWPDDTLLLTDPSYGIGYESHHNTNGRQPRTWGRWRRDGNFPPIQGDDAPFDPTPYLGFSKLILFGANYYATRLPDSRCWIVWDKREDVAPDQGADCELIWTNLDKPSRVYRHLWRGLQRRGEENVARAPKYHPHQKPVALLRWLIRYAEATYVLDPFAGSGSTLVAAKQLGLPAVGVEVEESYCRIAAERLEAQTPSLFPVLATEVG